MITVLAAVVAATHGVDPPPQEVIDAVTPQIRAEMIDPDSMKLRWPYPLTATALRKPFKNALKDAEIESFRTHDLRHTRATRIVRETGSLAAAQAALKHRSINTTLRYAHVSDDDTRRALEASESRNSPEASNSDEAETAENRTTDAA